jgi:hypothetical protein
MADGPEKLGLGLLRGGDVSHEIRFWGTYGLTEDFDTE